LGIEFGLPSKIIQGLYTTLREVQSTRSPWLGFSVMSREELAAQRGVLNFQSMPKPPQGIFIENLFTPSPAAESGVRAGDFLVSFDRQVVFTPVDFQRYLYLAGIGKRVRLEVFRDGKIIVLEITVTERPAEARPR
jgi:serine protease Do